MKLKKPQLASSVDRRKPAKTNPICGDPYYWFDTDFFKNNNLFVTTFDFFVDWEKKTFRHVAWIKRIISSGYSTDKNIIHDAILECDGNSSYERTLNFCKYNSIDLYYVLIPDINASDWVDLNNKVILFSVNRYEENNSAIESLNIKEIIDRIHNYKVEYSKVYMGAKGLQYSTSSLESFLSEQHNEIAYDGDAIYPGDADIIVFDKNYKPKIIIEIKKHTKAYEKAPTVKEDSIVLWYKDKNKYESLNILRNHWKCELYMLIYPTTDEKIVKFEKVSGFNVLDEIILPLPVAADNCSLNQFHEEFISFYQKEIPTSKGLGIKTNRRLVGKCPNCGNDVVTGEYGCYCSNKCGMVVGKAFGTNLSEDTVRDLLSGKESNITIDNKKVILLPMIKKCEYPNGIKYFWEKK